MSLVLHVLNIVIGCLCAVILGLTAHSIIIKNRIDSDIPEATKSTSISMLMWAGCGGVLDMLLFLALCSIKPFRKNGLWVIHEP